MIPRSTRLAALAIGVLAVTASAMPAAAQSDEDRRLDRLEKQVRELRSIVFQARDTGQPVEVKPAGPDPAVSALEQRADNADNTIRQLNGQLEVLSHDADDARQAAAAVREQDGELRGELKDLTDRVAKLEAAAAPAPPPPEPGAATPAPGAAVGPETLGGEADALASGAPPPPPPAAAPSAADAYRHARALLDKGDYPAASAAFQAFIGTYGSSPEVPTAYYWLGESDSARQAYGDAVPAYANALRGWPKTSWASDATVKLSRALAQTNQTDKACAALAEFDRRYRSTASRAVKARADDVRMRANCGG